MDTLQNISTDTLTQIVNQLVALAAPTKIVLFGSTARGDAHAHSDLDLLIVKKTVKDPYDESLRLGRALRHFMLPIDLVVVSEKNIHRYGDIPGTVYYRSEKEGQVLYAK